MKHRTFFSPKSSSSAGEGSRGQVIGIIVTLGLLVALGVLGAWLSQGPDASAPESDIAPSAGADDAPVPD